MKKLLGLFVSMSIMGAYVQNIIAVRNVNGATFVFIDTNTKKQ